VVLHYDLAVATNDDTQTVGGGFDGAGNAMPAEMLPASIKFHGVEFKLEPAKTGVPNAVIAKGQTIALPAGRINRIYVLAAATGGDQTASFQVGSKKVDLKIQDWSGFIGQWDTRIWNVPAERDWAISANHAVWPPADMAEREQRPIIPRYPEDYVGLKAGYVKTASLAWYASHHHTASGLNQPYEYSYLFAYPIEVTGDVKSITLPANEKIRILAISTAEENPSIAPVEPLYDTLGRTESPKEMEGNSR
jgi:alpha-mannosidase